MQPLLNIAVRAARRAAEVIVRSLNRLDSLEISSKSRNDFVTDVDRAAEAEIISTIRRASRPRLPVRREWRDRLESL